MPYDKEGSVPLSYTPTHATGLETVSILGGHIFNQEAAMDRGRSKRGKNGLWQSLECVTDTCNTSKCWKHTHLGLSVNKPETANAVLSTKHLWKYTFQEDLKLLMYCDIYGLFETYWKSLFIRYGPKFLGEKTKQNKNKRLGYSVVIPTLLIARRKGNSCQSNTWR